MNFKIEGSGGYTFKSKDKGASVFKIETNGLFLKQIKPHSWPKMETDDHGMWPRRGHI
jgi:hypothetical protein